MAKIYLLGNRASIELASKIGAELIEVTDLYNNDSGAINDFVVSNLRQKFDILVIDADNFQRVDVALAIGMYVRLSFVEIGMNALVPIIFVSDKRIKSFLNIKIYSQLLLTSNVYFQTRQNVFLEAVTPLDPKRYQDDFIDFIHVPAGQESGRHSLANQWGASVLDKLLNIGVPSDNPVLNTASKSLFFKYVYAQTINVADCLSGKQQIKYNMLNRPPINAKGKRVLLIDDEADKGWTYVLKRLIVTNEGDFYVIGHKAKDYNDFSKEEREEIEHGNYDLIFLDLRMNGADEENVYQPKDFSGMKILKQIKSKQPGVQVIMFTASNKAWNLKALLDEGADGYYIKESPEYKFSLGFSIANYDALRENIKDCLQRSYLRKVDGQIKAIKRDFNRTQGDTANLKKSIITQMDISYKLLESRHFEYAFISLYQTIELINDHYLDKDENNVWYILDTNEDAKNWTTQNFKHECLESIFTDKDRKDKYPEWKKLASLYYQLWKQEDKKWGYNVQILINERNKYMHNEIDRNSKIHTELGYMELLDLLCDICCYI